MDTENQKRLTLRCSTCGLQKPDESFWADRGPVPVRVRRGRKYSCKDCQKVNTKKYNDSRTESDRRSATLKHNYSMTTEQYEHLLKLQQGVCAICGKPETRKKGRGTLSVDHCHRTGAIRGLLCFACNTGLGRFHDDPEIVQAARSYLIYWL